MASILPKKAKAKKKDLREIPSDLGQAWDQKRIINKKALQDVEVAKMVKIQDIYKRELNYQLPDCLELIKKEWNMIGGALKRQYFISKKRVEVSDFDKKKWLGQMKDHDGFFKYESEQIVKLICEFQLIKRNRKLGSGSKSDPENLFCEEVKDWATKTLSMMECSIQTKELIGKRCRYLEEVLCEDDLFDRPISRVSHTIQQVIVAIRGILKYRTIPIIDRELAHHDARKAFDSIKKHLVMLMGDTLEFLSHVFRTSRIKSKFEGADTVSKIAALIMSDGNIVRAFPDDQIEIKERLMAAETNGESTIVVPPHNFLSLGAKGDIMFSSVFVCKDKNAQEQKRLVRLTDAHLQSVFVGEESGVEGKFRGNPYVAKQYLKACALVLELGAFFTIVEKAAACASQGGTLLVYGIANAHLNLMLDTCEHLMGELRETCSTLSRIAEVRFEELVFQNAATKKRNPWVVHYRNIHTILARIDKTQSTINQETAAIKTQANSLTLYEMFQKANEDTEKFLTASTQFAERMSNVFGLPYEPPKSPSVIHLPGIKELRALTQGTNGIDGLLLAQSSVQVQELKSPIKIEGSRNRMGSTLVPPTLQSPNPFDDSSNAPVLAYDDNMFSITQQYLQQQQSLTNDVFLVKQKLTRNDVPKIKQLITKDTTKIELMWNKLNGMALDELQNHIRNTCLETLEVLNLADNVIGDEGAEALCEMLIDPLCALSNLTLSGNRITDRGGKAIAMALAKNKSLEVLNLDCNQFSDSTLEDLEKALTNNTSSLLSNISISEFPDKRKFSKKGAKSLWNVMKSNKDIIFTGDPPFTLPEDLEEEEMMKVRTNQQTQSPVGKITGKLGEAIAGIQGHVVVDVFNKIAIESFNRMRQMEKFET